MRYSYFLGSAASLLASVSAHTWVEQLRNIADDGSYVGSAGYIRSYTARNDPNFNDAKMSWLSPQGSRARLSSADMLCHTNQRAAKQSDGFPTLSTKAGNTVALRYLENGHVTLPNNQLGKPASGGLVYIYATTNPKPDETLANVLQWGPDGSLDQGRLLNINPYDDGRCYQVNDAAAISVQRQAEFPNADSGGNNRELWCQNNVKIPQDATGTLTMFWVWQWPTQPGIDPGLPVGKDEIYTSCMDMAIVGAGVSLKGVQDETPLGAFEDPTPALPDFQQRLANTTLPSNSVFYGPDSVLGGSPPAQSPSAGTPGQFAPQPTATGTTMQTSARPTTTSSPGGQDPNVVYVTLTSTAYATVTVTDGAPAATNTPAQDNNQDGAQGGNQGGAQNGNQGGAQDGSQDDAQNGRPRGGRPRGNSAKFRR